MEFKVIYIVMISLLLWTAVSSSEVNSTCYKYASIKEAFLDVLDKLEMENATSFGMRTIEVKRMSQYVMRCPKGVAFFNKPFVRYLVVLEKSRDLFINISYVGDFSRNMTVICHNEVWNEDALSTRVLHLEVENFTKVEIGIIYANGARTIKILERYPNDEEIIYIPSRKTDKFGFGYFQNGKRYTGYTEIGKEKIAETIDGDQLIVSSLDPDEDNLFGDIIPLDSSVDGIAFSEHYPYASFVELTNAIVSMKQSKSEVFSKSEL